MTIEDISKEILKAATYHTNANLLATLTKGDDARKEEALKQMGQAESRIVAALQNFKQSIIDEVTDSLGRK